MEKREKWRNWGNTKLFVCTTNRSGFSFKSLKWNVNICCKQIKIRKHKIRLRYRTVVELHITRVQTHNTAHTYLHTYTKKIIKAHSAAYLPFLFYFPEEREYENCLMFLNSFFFYSFLHFCTSHLWFIVADEWMQFFALFSFNIIMCAAARIKFTTGAKKINKQTIVCVQHNLIYCN